MSNVTIELGGRRFTVACGDGEESHIEMLARTIHAKLSEIPGLAGQSAERTLLYAALLLADELHEASSAPPPAAVPDTGREQAEALESLAERMETIASQLESTAGNH